MQGTVVAALTMAWAWGVIAGGVCLNALIKSNKVKSNFRKAVPPPTVLTINTNDVLKVGIALAVVSALISGLCSTLIGVIFFARAYAARSFRAQSLLLFLCSLALLGTLIPFTYFFATRSAQVSASIGGIKLPDAVVKAAEKALGSTSVYKDVPYLKLVAILPWITFLFTVVAAVVLLVAGSARQTSAAPAAAQEITTNDGGKEKAETIAV
ncbi:hypothetical protein DXG03_000953 [Asterophora parasitica]|uniref:Uncharacterized protein n=1 Tax=Asterophora parasitica TaxID=117018 RepID=A0A9P7K6G2_9AGAR|nr:hypothetical protein DXG03_000953 [Asterophora parasitica]